MEISLKSTTISPPPPLPTTRSLDIWFSTNLAKVTSQFALPTSLKRVTYPCKPWWSELLSRLRKAYNSALRSSKRDRFDAALVASARAARSTYLKTIKKAKRDHWSSFLASATPQTVWTAKKLAVGRPPSRFPSLPGASTPPELNRALLDHFFPGEPAKFLDTILLPFRDCLPLAADKVGRALARSSPTSAPGLLLTPNAVWKRVHRVAPYHIHDLLAPLLTYGSHTLTVKKGRRHRARQAQEAVLRLPLVFPRHSPTPNLFENPRKNNELETLLRGPGDWTCQPAPVWLAGWPLGLGRSHHTHP